MTSNLTIFNILPEEINTQIYRDVYELCLDKILNAARKKHSRIIKNSKCFTCFRYPPYPEKFTFECYSCNSKICFWCAIISRKTKKQRGDKHYFCIFCNEISI